jgi:pimeloyl-ACP methyl ester carboxylesterase
VLVASVLLSALAIGAFGYTRLAQAKVEATYPPDGRFVPVEGGRLHVHEAGTSKDDGFALVLLHGASSNGADMMHALGRDLARDFRVVAIDRPGHGWSDRPGGLRDAQPDAQARMISQALAALGITRAVIVAHSLAGAVGVNFALRRADLAVGLVLLAPVTHPWPGGIAWYYGPASWPVFGPLFARLVAIPVASAVLEQAAAGVFAPQPLPVDYIEKARVRLLLRPATFVANAQDVSVLHAFVSRQTAFHGEIAQPVTLITGDRDETVSPVIHSQAFSREAQQAKLVVLPGVGHQPHYAAPDLVLAEIRALAAKVRAPDPGQGG